MLTGPLPATEKVLDKAGMNVKDIDIFEDYLKFIDQPEFFSGSDKSKKRSKGGFK